MNNIVKPIEPPDLGKVFQHDCGGIVFVFSEDGRVMCHGCKLLVPELTVIADGVVDIDARKHS